MKQLRLLQEYAGHQPGTSICVDAPVAELLLERGAAEDITPTPQSADNAPTNPAGSAKPAKKPRR